MIFMGQPNSSIPGEQRGERGRITQGLRKLDTVLHRKRRAKNISAGLARLDLELQAIEKPIWRMDLRQRRAA